MPRFNQKSVSQVGPTSPVTTTNEREYTYEGHKGWVRTPQSELFLLACSFMGGDDNFYEKSADRYARLVSLVNDKSVYTDLEWLFGFVAWLRNTANMRTVALVVAAESIVARLANDLTDPVKLSDPTIQISNRNVISAAMSRADEPAEMLAYWNHKHGGLLPQPFKAGIGDAVKRLYNEFSVLKYGDSRTASVTAKDVLRVVRPKPTDNYQAGLFGWITGAATLTGPETLPMIWARKTLSEIDPEVRDLRGGVSSNAQIELIREAGFTWENLSEWNPEGMNARAWEVMIPRMGVFALLRNLRNFDQAGISNDAVATVQKRLTVPGQIRKSGVLPFQVYGAFRAVESVRWASTLDTALTQCCDNVPTFDGETLVLVDMSQSMWFNKVSTKSQLTYADAAAVFAGALKVANPEGVDLYQFGSEHESRYNNEYLVGPWIGESWHRAAAYNWQGVTDEIYASRGASVFGVMSKLHCMGGTKIHRALAETYRPGKHTRIILLTDEQGFSSQYADHLVTENIPIYVWNFAGYRASVMEVGERNRHTMGGLTDDSFKMIPILEAGQNASWPWETRPDGPGPVAHRVNLSTAP